MKRIFALLLAASLISACVTAQTTSNAALRLSSVVVTNEQDLVGIEFAKTNHVEKIYAPGSSQTWMDGNGNKYEISHTKTLTFSPDFAHHLGGSLSQPSYTISYGETIEETSGEVNWHVQWGGSGVSVIGDKARNFDSWSGPDESTSITSTDGGIGTLYIANNPGATNLVESLAGKLSVTGGRLSGSIEFYNGTGIIKSTGGLGEPYPLALNYYGTDYWGGYPVDPSTYNSGVTIGKAPEQITPGYALDVAGPILVTELNVYGQNLSNYVGEQKELHRDSYTNVIWQTVFSNGWMWLVAYTNTPSI